jgi:hypothetical protein
MPFQKGNKIGLGRRMPPRTASWHEKRKHQKRLYGDENVSRRPEVRKKISDTKKGIPHPNQLGDKNGFWKGDKVGYQGIHAWVRRHRGRPLYCAYCQDTTKKSASYHWANISGSYKRDLSDWIRLCASCHKLYDLGKLNLESNE